MAEVRLEQFKTVRTTVSLPSDLVNWSQRFIDNGTVPSRNALIVAALEYFLAELERQEVDRQFALLVDDAAFQKLSLQVEDEFAESDWEATIMAEGGGE